jgi:cyclohexyl-isocyanide hydratase
MSVTSGARRAYKEIRLDSTKPTPARTLTRRDLLDRITRAAAAAAAAPWLVHCASTDDDRDSQSSDQPVVAGAAEPLQIAMLLYPGFTLLDLAGPQSALGFHGVTHIVSKTLEPVPTDNGLVFQPSATYDSCPRDLDALFVPGGAGTAEAMEDPDALRFLNDRAPRSKYVTSVCSGSLILAAAGLLQGYRATSHWAAYDALAEFDVDVVSDRVVIDRNRVTGGGVTAGIDFGLVLLARLLGDDVAKLQQLLMEYAPAPPFDTGTPAAAGPQLTQLAQQGPFGEVFKKAAAAAKRAAQRLS